MELQGFFRAIDIIKNVEGMHSNKNGIIRVYFALYERQMFGALHDIPVNNCSKEPPSDGL